MGIIQILLALLVLGYFLSSAVMVFFMWPSFRGQRKHRKQEKKIKLQRKLYKAIRQELDARETMNEPANERPPVVRWRGRVRDQLREELRAEQQEAAAPLSIQDKIEALKAHIKNLERQARGEPEE